MAIFTTYQGRFVDAAGEPSGRKHFSKNAKWFKYGKGAYNIDLRCKTYELDTIIPLLWEKKRFLYNLEFSNPIELKQHTREEMQEFLRKTPKDSTLIVPPISPEMYKIQLETEVMKKLNDLAKGSLAELLTPRNIIIGLVIIGVLIYVGTGHKLF